VVFLFHTIHGNEAPAEQCGQRMRSWLLAHPEAFSGLQIAFITQVNPDGYRAGTRFNVNGIDLNRNFPASNFEPSETFGPSPASEPETQVVVSIVEEASPAAIVTVHSPLDVINYDGPAQELAERAAADTGIPVDVDLGPYPGSFGSYAGLDLQIPAVTLELPSSVMARSGFEKWNRVEEVALEWVREQGGGSGVSLSDVVRGDNEEYEVMGLGDTPGGGPLVAERFGTEGKPVLVAAGLDGSDMAVFAAERYRARLLGRLGQTEALGVVLLITVAGEEVEAIGELAEAHAVAAVVEVRGSQDGLAVRTEGQADAMLQALDGVISGDYEAASERPGSLGVWAGGQGIPALVIEVPGQPEELGTLRAENIGVVLDAVVGAAPR
jgi:hypothetical protein